MAKSPWLGLVGVGVGVALLSIPRSETYSDYGLYVNAVEVKCGSVFDDSVETDFENPDEEYYYSSYDPIFDGKTADEVCKDLEKDAERGGWAAVGLGTVWLVGGLVLASSRRQNAATLQQYGASPRPQAPAPGPAAPGPAAPSANPARWLPDPQGVWEQRYWDGTRWTEHVASGGTVGVHPVSAPPPGFGADRSPAAGPTPAPAPVPMPAASPPPSAPPADRSGERFGAPVPNALSQVAPLPLPLAEPLDHDGRTMSRAAMPGIRPAISVRLRFDDGTTWEGSGPVLLGRDPAGQAGEGHIDLHPISDSTRSVSKTHLLVTPTAGGVRIVDRHSSNGTEIVVAGIATSAPPGVATEVPFGATVHVGDRLFVVERLG